MKNTKLDLKIDTEGNTYLHKACLSEDKDLVILLLNNGADPTILNDDQENCLHLVCYADPPDIELVKLLLTKGVNPSIKNQDNETVLHIICKYRNPNIAVVTLLLDSGADLNIKNINNNTCLDFVYNCETNFPVIELLLKKGGKIDTFHFTESKKNNIKLALLLFLSGSTVTLYRTSYNKISAFGNFINEINEKSEETKQVVFLKIKEAILSQFSYKERYSRASKLEQEGVYTFLLTAKRWKNQEFWPVKPIQAMIIKNLSDTFAIELAHLSLMYLLRGDQLENIIAAALDEPENVIIHN